MNVNIGVVSSLLRDFQEKIASDNMKNSSDINALFLLQEKVAALRAASAIQLCRRGQSVCTVQRNQARLLPNFTTVLFTVCGRNASSTGHSPSMAAVLMLCLFITHNIQLKLSWFALLLFFTGFLCHQSELMMPNTIIKENVLLKKIYPSVQLRTPDTSH